jgi:hypothetical protein
VAASATGGGRTRAWSSTSSSSAPSDSDWSSDAALAQGLERGLEREVADQTASTRVDRTRSLGGVAHMVAPRPGRRTQAIDWTCAGCVSKAFARFWIKLLGSTILLCSSIQPQAPSPQGKSTKQLHPANLQPFWSSAPSLLPQPPCLSDGCPRHLSRLASCQFSIHGPSRRRLRCFEEIAKHPCSCRGASKTGPLQLERRDGGASGFRVSVYGLGTVRDLGFRV